MPKATGKTIRNTGIKYNKLPNCGHELNIRNAKIRTPN
jgi:hypothetical protein